jgi:hypothetical protein
MEKGMDNVLAFDSYFRYHRGYFYSISMESQKTKTTPVISDLYHERNSA